MPLLPSRAPPASVLRYLPCRRASYSANLSVEGRDQGGRAYEPGLEGQPTLPPLPRARQIMLGLPAPWCRPSQRRMGGRGGCKQAGGVAAAAQMRALCSDGGGIAGNGQGPALSGPARRGLGAPGAHPSVAARASGLMGLSCSESVARATQPCSTSGGTAVTLLPSSCRTFKRRRWPNCGGTACRSWGRVAVGGWAQGGKARTSSAGSAGSAA